MDRILTEQYFQFPHTGEKKLVNTNYTFPLSALQNSLYTSSDSTFVQLAILIWLKIEPNIISDFLAQVEDNWKILLSFSFIFPKESLFGIFFCYLVS